MNLKPNYNLFDRQHALRVADLTYAIALQAGLSERLASRYKKAGYLHDYGKIFLPADLINKQGPLTDTEFEIIQNHISMGFDALARTRIRGHCICADVALFHHERLNGSGYIGLQHKAICTASRIVAIADVFDAMTHDRPYKKAKSKHEALAYFDRYAGLLFDESYVVALKRLFRTHPGHYTF
jgi:putative two-component system response regulator